MRWLFWIFVIFIACSPPKNPPDSYNSLYENLQTELGRYLFYDTRISWNQSKSCGTCHNPNFSFTDGYKRSLGIYADVLQRNTAPLFNLSELKYLTAADSNIKTLIRQIDNPLFNEHPLEMGVRGHENEILERFKRDKFYELQFNKLKMPINWQNIKLTITKFVNSLKSYQSPYDQYLKGTYTMTDQQKRGMNLFYSDSLACSKCHSGINFSEPTFLNKNNKVEYYYNTGLYNVNEKNEYPQYDTGLSQVTHNQEDMGKFRVPSLRNLTFTAPYYHDGSAESLMEVIRNYERGGRLINNGQYKGDGFYNRYKHPLIKGFKLSTSDRINIVKFLELLSDTSFIHNPKYNDPISIK